MYSANKRQYLYGRIPTHMEKHSSKILEEAVEAFASLPGVGRKSALRLALHCIYQADDKVGKFTRAVQRLSTDLRFCKKCHHISDHEICHICSDSARQKQLLCLVESVRDVLAIEETGHFRGTYHVLGGIISPIDGIGPEDLNIDSLISRCRAEQVEEVIMAISPTIDGETTIYYVSRCLAEAGLKKVSVLARGVAFGGELEYADEMTLGRSIRARIPYEVAE